MKRCSVIVDGPLASRKQDPRVALLPSRQVTRRQVRAGRLIASSFAESGFRLPAQPLLRLGRIFLDPSVNGLVIDRHAALGHHLLEVAVAYAVAAIPTYRPKHDLAPGVAPFEVRHGLSSPRSDLPLRSTRGFATVP